MRGLNFHNVIDEIIKDTLAYVPKDKDLVIGISGGLDSTIAAYIAVKGFGRDRVRGISLPCGIQSDMADVDLVFDALGIEKHEYNIEKVVEANLALDDNYRKGNLTKGNMMARTRMLQLYAQAGTYNGIVLGTTNRCEWEVGYFTKGGDGVEDVAMLMDLFKSEEYEIGRILGIPKRILEKKPTAGLWIGQTDEEELRITYDQIEACIRGLETNQAVLDRYNYLHAISQHKRDGAHIAHIVSIK